MSSNIITSKYDLEMEKSKILEAKEKFTQLVISSRMNESWKDAILEDMKEIDDALDLEYDEMIKSIEDKERQVGNV